MVDKDALFHELSKEIPAGKYSRFCHNMGFNPNEAKIMLTKYLYNYNEALRDLLYQWDRRQGVAMKQLEDALVAAEVEGLISILKKHVKDAEKEREEHIKNLSDELVNVKPIKMECCKKVGVEGGKLQLDSFGIELDIPPGAIDSKAPQDISLRVLTDTPNLGNSKAEVSVCFGVQCLAPDDLVLKLPVTYTIPHCAVSSRYSSVEAVLYTGEGEYSPDAVVKERIVLSRSGTPIIIKKDVLILKMNHFSWAKVMFIISQFFFREKMMCCRPFKEKNLALQRRSVILHAQLYDDIKGNKELVKLEEEEYFIPADAELRELRVQTAQGDLKMTCYLRETVIGGPAVVPCDKLMSRERICVPFELDFTNQSDSSVAVSLIVERNGNLDKLSFRLEDGRQETSPQDQASAEVVAATGVVAGDDAAQRGGGPTSDIRLERTTETNDGNRSSTIFSWTGISKELIPYLGIVACVGVGLFFLNRRKN